VHLLIYVDEKCCNKTKRQNEEREKIVIPKLLKRDFLFMEEEFTFLLKPGACTIKLFTAVIVAVS
jgi:hypothetical protein